MCFVLRRSDVRSAKRILTGLLNGDPNRTGLTFPGSRVPCGRQKMPGQVLAGRVRQKGIQVLSGPRGDAFWGAGILSDVGEPNLVVVSVQSTTAGVLAFGAQLVAGREAVPSAGDGHASLTIPDCDWARTRPRCRSSQRPAPFRSPVPSPKNVPRVDGTGNPLRPPSSGQRL